MELELQKDQSQAAGMDTPQTGEPPETDRTYTRLEVEQVIREHLIRFQSLPVQEPQQAELADQELALKKKTYLMQEIHKFAATLPPEQLLRVSSSYETFTEKSKNLYLFLENEDMDSFIKTVDAIFSLIRYAQELSYKKGYDERADEERGRPGEINLPKEPKKDVITEVFKMGGRI